MKRRSSIPNIVMTTFLMLGAWSSAGAAELPASANDIDPVGTGDSIPAATVRTAQGDDFDLVDAVSAQPAILIFYRGGW